jgi:hypothetical protein
MANSVVYTNISAVIMETHFGTKKYHEGLKEINNIFRVFIDNRMTVQAEYYHFRERALKNIITTMSHARDRADF